MKRVALLALLVACKSPPSQDSAPPPSAAPSRAPAPAVDPELARLQAVASESRSAHAAAKREMSAMVPCHLLEVDELVKGCRADAPAMAGLREGLAKVGGGLVSFKHRSGEGTVGWLPTDETFENYLLSVREADRVADAEDAGGGKMFGRTFSSRAAHVVVELWRIGSPGKASSAEDAKFKAAVDAF